MTRWRPIATTAVSLLGLGLAAFLTWAHYFDQAAINRTCPLGTTSHSSLFQCGLVTTSPESVIFHLPVALYGLCYFVVMLVLSLPAAWRSGSELVAKGRVALVVLGMGFVVYLVSVEVLQVHHLCLYCSCVHLLQFALFLLVVTGWYDTGYAAMRYGDDEDDDVVGEGSLEERRLLDA